MLERLRKWLPDQDALRRSRWLRWLGPALHDARLWRMQRRGVSLGMAVGVFFGLLVPLAQIPLAAGAAVLLRANVPVAVASTLVTNPVTFAPVYFVAWRIGTVVLGTPDEPPPDPAASESSAQGVHGDEAWIDRVARNIAGVGKPLLVGLPILATIVGLATYVLVSSLWNLKVSLAWRRRRSRVRP